YSSHFPFFLLFVRLTPRYTLFPYTTLFRSRLLCQSNFRLFLVACETKPQEFTFPRTGYHTLFPIYLESKFLFDKRCDGFHHSLPSTFGLHVNLEIIRISHEFMTTLLQFFVQFI